MMVGRFKSGFSSEVSFSGMSEEKIKKSPRMSVFSSLGTFSTHPGPKHISEYLLNKNFDNNSIRSEHSSQSHSPCCKVHTFMNHDILGASGGIYLNNAHGHGRESTSRIE